MYVLLGGQGQILPEQRISAHSLYFLLPTYFFLFLSEQLNWPNTKNTQEEAGQERKKSEKRVIQQ